MLRTWTEVGAGFDRAQVEAAIATLQWSDVNADRGAMQDYAIKAAIVELEIPRVARVAEASRFVQREDTEGSYLLFAIEGRYLDGRAIVYILDGGDRLIPVASDFEPTEAPSPTGV